MQHDQYIQIGPPDVPLESIFKGIFPFLVALIIVTIMLAIFPQIATFLPSLVSY